MSFFTFWRQLFHLFLADWGFPSLGIKQFQAGCGIAPMIIFPCFFLRLKMIYLLMDSTSWHGARPTDRREDLAVHPTAPSLTASFFSASLPPSSSWLYLEVLSPSQWSLICYFVIAVLASALLSSPFPHLRSLSFFPFASNDPPLFKLFSGGCPNPSFSTSVHKQFQKSSEETVTEQV